MNRFSNDPIKNKETAISIIQNFIDSKLGGDREKLRTFSFWGIDKDKDFGNGLDYSDGDRTRVAYAIDYLLFYEKLEKTGFKIYGYSTEKETYSGETLNTFNTLFSSSEENRTALAKIYGIDTFKNECYNPNGKNNSEDFYHIYQRLGNFSIFPCLTIDGQSINTLKGTDVTIKDYLYPFLENLEEAYKLYEKNEQDDQNELLLLMTKNEFFFNEIKSFPDFIELFMLEGWKKLKLSSYLKNAEINSDNIHIVNDYITKAKNFIINRTNRMVDELFNSYPNIGMKNEN